MSSAADGHQQHSMGKRTCSIQSKINSQNDCWWSEHEPGNSSLETDWKTGDEKNLCQDGAQQIHRATVGFAVECSFWHLNALRWCCSLLTHLISHPATSKSKTYSERTPFWVNRRYPEGCKAGLKWHPKGCIQGMLKQWQHRWKRCVQAQGMYFEGDHTVVDE